MANGIIEQIQLPNGDIYDIGATSVPLSGVTDADDLKAIEALTGTSGVLIKTAANTWALDPTPYVSNISWENTNGTISRTINGVAADVVKEVPGYNTETITTLVDNLTISNFYLDDTYNTELYRSENNALIGLTTTNFDSNGSYIVVWDGTTYNCEFQIMPSSTLMNSVFTDNGWWDCRLVGDSTLLNFAPIDSTTRPFLISYRYNKDTNFILWTNSTATSHTITIKKVERNYKTLNLREMPEWYRFQSENLSIVRKGNGENIIIGNSPNAIGQGAISIGSNSFASAKQAISIGSYSKALGDASTTIGYKNTTSDYYGVAIGAQNGSSGTASVAIGYMSSSSGWASIAMGYNNTAAETASIAMGRNNQTNSSYSLAAGYNNSTSGTAAIALGRNNQSNSDYSLSMGYGCTASEKMAIAAGYSTKATGRAQTAIGSCNIEDTDDGTNYTQYGAGARKYLFIIGNGISSARSNALTVDWDGNLVISGSYTGTGEGLTNVIEIVRLT